MTTWTLDQETVNKTLNQTPLTLYPPSTFLWNAATHTLLCNFSAAIDVPEFSLSA